MKISCHLSTGRPLVTSIKPFFVVIASVIISSQTLAASDSKSITEAAAGLQLRSIGPALMGGRISDIAVNPVQYSTWYVAVGSGGVWKTINAGITFEPVFDAEGSYSIADIAIDPNNTDIVWVGSGENVSGRHVGWGDGVYKSTDGGKSWTNVGLENSQHIGKVLIDPRDGNVVYVASEGPLWSAGGDRGLYKTLDSGANWERVLDVDENTGRIFDRDAMKLWSREYEPGWEPKL